jgi:hypothetical protein
LKLLEGLITIACTFLVFLLPVMFAFFFGKYSAVTLLEYQRGIIYWRGRPNQDVGPGRHRVWTGFEKLYQLDVRPVQVCYENQQVGLRDGTSAQYSFSGSAGVCDTRKAIYSSYNSNLIPAYVLLCCTRFVLNLSTSSQVKFQKDAILEQISERAKPRLAAAGFELLSFRISQLVGRGDAAQQQALEL